MSEINHNRGSPRLFFSEEERIDPKLCHAIAKVEKASDKVDTAQKRLKTRKRLVLSKGEEATLSERLARPSIGNQVKEVTAAQIEKKLVKDILPTRNAPALPMKTEEAKIIAKKQTVRLHFEESKAKPPSQLHHPVEKELQRAVRRKISASNEDDNAATNAALKTDDGIQSALQMGNHAYHALKERPYQQAEKAERKLDKANIRFLETKANNKNPQLTSNPLSRMQQKRAIRKEYAAAKAGRSTTIRTRSTAQATEQAATKVGSAARRIAVKLRQNPKVWFIGLVVGMLMVVMSGLQSCTPLAQSVLESIVIGTYPATEDDVRAAERAYAAKEDELKDQLDHYGQLHPEYDEITVVADEIWHDPYALIAIISAYYDGQDWTIDNAYPVIEQYFNLQYELTETVTSETRYKRETQTGTRLVTDPSTGRTHTETYTYEADVPYSYKTCAVTLENKNLSHMPVYSMSHHAMGMYALYMSTHGNMEGIFTGGHATPLRDPYIYEIPQETLDASPMFATLMEEANKYIGYPYVWGGASPETSFDCSGFVSYVFTTSGVYNTGRLGATGLRNLCHDVSSDQLQPGDLVFFEGTIDGEDGITHVGIYVGNNRMIHCGSPIGYADLTDSYYREHFHSYGRIPY